ncbi:MAG: hypothetical protein N2439_17405, partial [Anaerolineae bacterium]|nr:hypothetical protein [Anaerolineae bacterium]
MSNRNPSLRQAALQHLRQALQLMVLQDLRAAAQARGWTVRGTAKADVIQGIVEHLSNAQEMAAAFARLPAFQRKVMIWLAQLSQANAPIEALVTTLEIIEGERTTKEAVTQALTELYRRLFVLVHPTTRAFHVPDLYREWLPGSDV